MKVDPRTARAIARYGPRVNRLARKRYGISGQELLGRLVVGESGDNMKAVSVAGARGKAQFISGTRDAVKSKYGIDPWRSTDEAVHAAVLHLKGKITGSKGLEGYNPGGGQGYVNYILGQDVGGLRGRKGAPPASRHTPASKPSKVTSSKLVGGRAPKTKVDVSAAILDALLSPDKSSSLLQRTMANIDTGAYTTRTAGKLPKIKTTTVKGQTAPAGGKPGQTKMTPAKAGQPTLKTTSVLAQHETAGLPGYPAHDYMAPAGSAAVAPVSGRVIRFSGHDPAGGPTDGPHGPFGWSMYIKGDDGRTYYLTHMGSRTVKVGQRVSQGQKIGTVGNYAKWNGADHIHMGVHG